VTTVVRNLPPGTVFYEPGQAPITVPGTTTTTLLPHFSVQPTLLKCGICSEIFSDEAKFRQHAFMHEQVNLLKNDPPNMLKPGTFECKFCRAIFDDKERLKQHYDDKHRKEFVQIQPLDQLYQCALCDLRFLHHSAFIQHQQTHAQRKEVYILPKKQIQSKQIISIASKGLLFVYHHFKGKIF